MTIFSRRSFTKFLTFFLGSASFSSLFGGKKSLSSPSPSRLVIVGGGLAGLTAAYYLKKAGLTATVYEASERLGGRILSANLEGQVVNLGASFINSDHQDMLELVKEFNLDLIDRHNDIVATRYYLDKRFIEEGELVTQLTPFLKQIEEDRQLLEKDDQQYALLLDQLSVQEYLDKNQDKIPTNYLRNLLENLIRSEYGVEPENSSALQLIYLRPQIKDNRLELLGSSDERFMVAGGNSQLIKALARELAGQIQTRKPLIGLEKRDIYYLLTFADKSTQEADWVILALPFTVLRHLDLKLPIPPKLQRFIQEVSLGSNEKLTPSFTSQNLFKIKEIWTDLSLCLVWDENSEKLKDKTGSLTYFFGGRQTQEVETNSSQDLSRFWVSQLEQWLGIREKIGNKKALKTQWSNNPWSYGAYTSFSPGQLTEFQEFLSTWEEPLHLDKLIFVGEHLSGEFYGYMNGAAETGRRAAKYLIEKNNPS
jgi:monoamine oxidase